MKSIKFILVITALLLIINTGFSQSTESHSKAVSRTEKIDKELKSENPALALTDSQKAQIIALQLERLEEVSAFRENNSNEAEVKAKSKELNKAMNNKLRNDVFTEEQAKAKEAYRKKMKGQKGKRAGKANKSSKKVNKKKAKNPVTTMTIAEADEIYAAASAKQKARAEKATEKLNVKISAADSSLALSEEQRKQINALNIKPKFEDVKKNKKYITSILTKEQKSAIKKKK